MVRWFSDVCRLSEGHILVGERFIKKENLGSKFK